MRLRSAASSPFNRCSTIISARQNALRRAAVMKANQAVAWRKNPVNLTEAGSTGQSLDAFLASKNQAAQNATGCLGTPKKFMHRRKPIK